MFCILQFVWFSGYVLSSFYSIRHKNEVSFKRNHAPAVDVLAGHHVQVFNNALLTLVTQNQCCCPLQLLGAEINDLIIILKIPTIYIFVFIYLTHTNLCSTQNMVRYASELQFRPSSHQE